MIGPIYHDGSYPIFRIMGTGCESLIYTCACGFRKFEKTLEQKQKERSEKEDNEKSS